MTLEKLPPVLVLHLKRFVYEKTGGCQKLIKNIEYPVDLEISKGNMCVRRGLGAGGTRDSGSQRRVRVSLMAGLRKLSSVPFFV